MVGFDGSKGKDTHAGTNRGETTVPANGMHGFQRKKRRKRRILPTGSHPLSPLLPPFSVHSVEVLSVHHGWPHSHSLVCGDNVQRVRPQPSPSHHHAFTDRRSSHFPRRRRTRR